MKQHSVAAALAICCAVVDAQSLAPQPPIPSVTATLALVAGKPLVAVHVTNLSAAPLDAWEIRLDYETTISPTRLEETYDGSMDPLPGAGPIVPGGTRDRTLRLNGIPLNASLSVQMVIFGDLSSQGSATEVALYNREGATQSTMERASGEIELLIRQALEDRLAANGVPGLDLLRSSTRLGVRDEMPKAGLKLSRAVLPIREGYEFYLVSPAAAQADADQSGHAVFFLVVDRPSIDGDTATAWLGMDVVFPRQLKVDKLCCCIGEGQFRRADNRWTFLKWATMSCS